MIGRNMERWEEEAHGEKGAAEIPDQTSEQAVLAPGHPRYRQTDKTHNSYSLSLGTPATLPGQALVRAKSGGCT